METIIIRKKTYEIGYVNSAFIEFQKGRSCLSCDALVKKFGWRKVMLSLFKECIDDDFEKSSLIKSYQSLLKCENLDNEDFIKAYKINDRFAIYADASIYLFHLFPKGEVCTDIVPWYCTDGQVYLGDTWWEKNEEILSDIQSMSLIDFYTKYKGWSFPDKKLF